MMAGSACLWSALVVGVIVMLAVPGAMAAEYAGVPFPVVARVGSICVWGGALLCAALIALGIILIVGA